jgi:heme oxygenase
MSETASVENTFLHELRSQTQPLHQALELLPLSAAIVAGSLTKDQYISYLQAMYPVVRELEEDIYPRLREFIPDLPQRAKLQMLKRDLDFLNALPEHPPKPFEAAGYEFSVPSAMGIMYVIEGSTLGGRVIVKNVEKVLGFDDDNGAVYFSGYGKDTGVLWKAFLQHFQSFEAKGGNGREIIEGANSAFRIIHNILKKQTEYLNED